MSRTRIRQGYPRALVSGGGRCRRERTSYFFLIDRTYATFGDIYTVDIRMSRAIRLALLCTLVVAGGCSQNMLASGAKGGEPKLKPMAPEIRVDGSKITMTVPACRLDQLLPLVGGELGLDLKSAPELGHAILLTRVEDEQSESVLNRIADAVDGRWEGNGKSRVLVPDPKKEAANSEKLVQALMAKQENLARLGRGGSLKSPINENSADSEDYGLPFLSKVVPQLDMRKLAALPDFGTYVLTTSKDTLGDPMSQEIERALIELVKRKRSKYPDEYSQWQAENDDLNKKEWRLSVTRRNMGQRVQFNINSSPAGPPMYSPLTSAGTLTVDLLALSGPAIAMSKSLQDLMMQSSDIRNDPGLKTLWPEFRLIADLWKKGGTRSQYDKVVEVLGDPVKQEPMAGAISKAILYALKMRGLETVTVLPDSLMYLPFIVEQSPQNSSHIAVGVERAAMEGRSNSSVKRGWWSIEFPSGASWRSMVSDRKKIASAAQLAKILGQHDLRVRVATFAATKNSDENPGGLAWQIYGPQFGVIGRQETRGGVSMIRNLLPAEVDLLAEGKEVRLNPSDDRARPIVAYLLHSGNLLLKRAPDVRPYFFSKDIPPEVWRLDRSSSVAPSDFFLRSQFPSEIRIRRTTHRILLGRTEDVYKQSIYPDQLGAMAAMSARESMRLFGSAEAFSKIIPIESVMEQITVDIGRNRVVNFWTTLSEKVISSKALAPAQVGGEWGKQYQRGIREWSELRANEEALYRTKSPGQVFNDQLRAESGTD